MYEVFERLMKIRGITAYKVCKDTGVSQATISRWKNGKSEPSLETMQQLAEYFGVSVDYLLSGGEEGVVPAKEVGFDDFTYALYNEAKELSDDQKETLLGMARFFRQQLDAKKADEKKE